VRTSVLLSQRLYSHGHHRLWIEHQRFPAAEVLSPPRSHGRGGGRRRPLSQQGANMAPHRPRTSIKGEISSTPPCRRWHRPGSQSALRRGTPRVRSSTRLTRIRPGSHSFRRQRVGSSCLNSPRHSPRPEDLTPPRKQEGERDLLNHSHPPGAGSVSCRRGFRV
jgi:hypothetical protein